jgi:hypothetical protein
MTRDFSDLNFTPIEKHHNKSRRLRDFVRCRYIPTNVWNSRPSLEVEEFSGLNVEAAVPHKRSYILQKKARHSLAHRDHINNPETCGSHNQMIYVIVI